MENPLNLQTKNLNEYFMDWDKMHPVPYDKDKVEPYTKVRQILMNGTEFEANWFLHQFARHCNDNDLRRIIAVVRAQEQQQQKRLSALKPADENMLETTIGYEQLAIDLTAILSKMETDQNNINALNFALLEDFDHLYRFGNLLKMDFGIDTEKLVGGYTEVMPARPTIAEHRFAADKVKKFMDNKNAAPLSKLIGSIITAAEQQTMNFYMNMAAFYKNEYGRRLFSEIALVEEEHVTQYESLNDPNATWLECWVMHEYTECYLYYSMSEDETDKNIRKIYREHYEMEAAHLKTAIECLQKYEGKKANAVLPNPEFPMLLKFGANIEFIREVLKNTVELTGHREEYVNVNKLDEDSDFKRYQAMINKKVRAVPSHAIIEESIDKDGKDYRYEVAVNPIPSLQNRTRDNTTLGR